MIFKLFLSPVFFLCISFFNADTAIEWNPETKFIPYSIADPKTPAFKISYENYLKKDIPFTSKTRSVTSLGAVFPTAKSGKFQLNTGASFYCRTDIENSFDITGWDGLILNDLAYKFNNKSGIRFSSKHFSGHLGDEYIKKSGWERVSKSRDENALAFWFMPFDNTSFIFETGYDQNYNYKKEHKYEASELRYQIAAFHIKDEKNSWLPFWGTDIQFFQEDNYKPSLSFQTGYSFLDNNNDRFRMAVEYYRGKVRMMEFSGYREEYIGLAFIAEF